MLLVTTSHSVLVVDPAAGSIRPAHRGLGLYYGIASNGDRTYIAARGRMVSSTDPREEERGRILVFDRALRQAGEIVAPFALRDMHELMWWRGSLWITCCFDNMIAILDVGTGAWEQWFPLGVTPAPPLDVNHLNSLAVVDGSLYMIAHNFGDSELLCFDSDSRALRSRVPLGAHAHNIHKRKGGSIMTCSSAEGALLDVGGWRLDVGGFPRGLLFGDRETYVGISGVAGRKDRDQSDGHIAVYDPDWRLLRTLALPDEGLILDIQPLAPGR